MIFQIRICKNTPFLSQRRTNQWVSHRYACKKIQRHTTCIFYFPPCKGSPVSNIPGQGNHPRRWLRYFLSPNLAGTVTGQSGRWKIKNTGSRSRTCLTDKIESIGDTSLQNCLDRLKKWEENPDHPSEISLYYDHAPYSFGFTQRYPDGSIGIVGGLLYHGIPDQSFAVTLEPFHGWQIHT